MIEWTNTKSVKRWVKIENRQSRAQLNKNIWIPQNNRMLVESTHKLIRNIFKVWDIICRQAKWEYKSPLISLGG